MKLVGFRLGLLGSVAHLCAMRPIATETVCLRKRTGEAGQGPSVARIIVAPRWHGIVERYTAPVVPTSVGRFVLKRALVFALGKPGCQCFPMLGPGQSKKNSVSSALPSNSDISRSSRHFAFVRTGDSRSAAVTRLIQSACRRAVGMILVS